jgi:hypothetical protein
VNECKATDINFQQTPAIQFQINQKLHFLHVGALSYLTTASIFAFIVEGVTPEKIMNFKEYPSIASSCSARRFITVQINFDLICVFCGVSATD